MSPMNRLSDLLVVLAANESDRGAGKPEGEEGRT